MNKKKVFDQIVEWYTKFRLEVETFNSAGLFDVNIYSESVLIPLLNMVYGLNLIDANKGNLNNSAVDLIDNENRVSIQVTSTSGGEKVKHTLETYIKDEKYRDFDSMFVYILTKKQKKYADNTFDKIIEGKFEFNSTTNIIDHSDILNEVKSWLSMSKLIDFKDFLEEQFCDDAKQRREYYIENKDELESQTIYPNILKVKTPEFIYVGKLNIDREEVVKRSWETEYKLKFKANIRKVIRSQMYYLNLNPSIDWHVFEDNLISFKNLNSEDEALSKLIEIGTVEQFTVEEFNEINEGYSHALSRLISLSFTELLQLKEIRWLPKQHIYRFSSMTTRRVTWKKKNKATRTVVKEQWSKDKTRILAFQHQAFGLRVFSIDNLWYISITPTYSITYDGYNNHGSASKFVDSQKKLDKNQSVYNHFRFIAYCLNNKITDEEGDYQHIGVMDPIKLTLTFKKQI